MPTSVMPGKDPRDVPAAYQACTTCGEVFTGSHDCPGTGPAAAAVSQLPTSVGVMPGALMQASLRTGLGTRAEIELELDGIAMAMRAFALKQPDQVMREVAAYSARLTELTVLLHRVESQDRQYTRVRTQQVEKFLAELDRQFKISSRLVEVMRQDLELMR